MDCNRREALGNSGSGGRESGAHLSNKEIGSRIFLSERTLEAHVSNILDQLGVNSRVEIARWVAEEARLG